MGNGGKNIVWITKMRLLQKALSSCMFELSSHLSECHLDLYSAT